MIMIIMIMAFSRGTEVYCEPMLNVCKFLKAKLNVIIDLQINNMYVINFHYFQNYFNRYSNLSILCEIFLNLQLSNKKKLNF